MPVKFLRSIVLSLVVLCLSGTAIAFDIRVWCGRKIANAADPLLLALKQNPEGLRRRLQSEASQNGFDLTAVLLPEAAAHCQWMSGALRDSSAGTQALRFLTGGAYHRLSREQNEFLSRLQSRLESLSHAPDRLTYADYLQVSGVFALGREITLNPRGLRIPLEYNIDRYSASWGGFALDGLWTAPAPSVVDSYDRGVEGTHELSDYALIPLQQEIIDDYLLGDDQVFLRMIAHRLYPIGLNQFPLDVHSDVTPPVRFGEHDLLHARINLRAWREMRKKASDPRLHQVLRNWYRATYDGAESVVNELVLAMGKIEDPWLRRSVQAVSWDMFHENEVPFNALDAYSLVRYHLSGQDTGSRFELGTYYFYRKNYGSKVKYAEALQWHYAYWENLLPSIENGRTDLLRAQEEYLLDRKKIIPRGGVRYQFGALRE